MYETMKETKIKSLDHIGIAVKNIEDHIPYYRDILKLEYLGTKIVESQKKRQKFHFLVFELNCFFQKSLSLKLLSLYML